MGFKVYRIYTGSMEFIEFVLLMHSLLNTMAQHWP